MKDIARLRCLFVAELATRVQDVTRGSRLPRSSNSVCDIKSHMQLDLLFENIINSHGEDKTPDNLVMPGNYSAVANNFDSKYARPKYIGCF